MSGYGGEAKRRVGKDFVEHPDLVATLRAALCPSRENFQCPAGNRGREIHRHGPDQGRDRALQEICVGRLRRAVHDRAVARHRGDYADECALRLARGVRERARDGDFQGISRDPRGGTDPAGRRARSRDGARDEFPGRDRRGFRQDRRDASRGDQQGLRGHSGRPLAAAHLLGQLGRPARLRHRAREGAAGVLSGDRLRRSRSSSPIRATSTNTRRSKRIRSRRTRS